MSKLNRVALALAIAGASATLAACGDDDDTTPSNGNEDAGKPDGGGTDSGRPDSSTPPTSGDGGVEEDAEVPVLPDCPDHPNVNADGDDPDFCVLTGVITSPIVEDLEISPVEGKKWLISGAVFVGEDVGGDETPDASATTATLTIAPGTTLYADTTESFLLIQRGSKINAKGTANAPIVFTTFAEPATSGSWGGLLLNGRAHSNQGTAVTGEAGTGVYGGTDDEDSSGTVSYVRIEFGGAQLTADNEFNGLTLSGVGSGTQIDHVHIHACNDDGIEFFGGSVDAKYIVSSGNGDDGLDWTGGYNGKVQFAIVQQRASTSSNDPRGIEADNTDPESSNPIISEPILSNLTVIGSTDVVVASNANGAMLRRGTRGQIHNSIIANFKNACVRVDGMLSQENAVDGSLIFANSRISCADNFHDDASAVAFAEANGNAEIDGVDVLEDALSDEPNFTPTAASNLLTGGVTPDDAFFDDVEFIGAIGDEDWTAVGSWVSYTAVGG